MLFRSEKLLLIRTNNYGDTVWTKHYPKIGSAYGNYGIATKDGGFIAVGIDGLAFYIVKTDSMGNVKTSVGITEANQPQFDFNIYPNPGKGLFRINFEGISANSQIKVLNNKGELILDLSIKPCNEYCFIDLSNYAEGIYLVRLENGKIYKSKKIVLIK